MISLKRKGILYFPSWSQWIFLILITALFFIYGYHEILFLRPQSVHQWRQCDCLSISLNYFQDGNSFFQPAIHNAGDGSGRAAGEFPGLYFLVAQIWKIFGPHEFIYRLLVILISFTGLFVLFRLAESLLKDSFWALWITGMLFTSPLLVYYSNNFLVNVPALSLSILGMYFFYKYYLSGSSRYLFFLGSCFVFAGLLKVSALCGFLVIASVWIAESFNVVKFRNDRKIFGPGAGPLLMIILVPIIVSSWYFYAASYNRMYNENIFLMKILPVWDMDRSGLSAMAGALWDNLRWNYFRPSTEVLLLCLFLGVIVSRKKSEPLLYWMTIVFAAGFFIFILFFFQNLNVHDYYLIDFLLLVPLVMLTFLKAMKAHFPGINASILLRIAAIAFLVHNVDFARRRIEGRYDENSPLNRNRSEYTHALESIAPYLRSIGIRQEDKIICFPDPSPNISLYLLNQKGWTNYNVPMDSVRIRQKIEMGAKYLLIYDDKICSDENVAPFLKEKIGSHSIVSIYRL